MQSLPSKVQLKQEPYKRVLNDIQQSLEEFKEPTVKVHEFFTPEYKKPNKFLYAEELRKQIELNKIKAQKEKKIDNGYPKDNEEFSGYPNRIQTPKSLRRAAEQEKMKILKNDLKDQIEQRKLAKQVQSSLELQKVKKILNTDIEKFEDSKSTKFLQKESEKNILTQSWSKAIKSKNMGSNIFNPVIEPIKSKDFELNRRLDYEKSGSYANFKKDLNDNYKEALDWKKKDEDEKSKELFFEEKIKKIIEDVKRTKCLERKNHSKKIPKVGIILGGRKHYLL